MSKPIMPRHPTNPVGQVRRIRDTRRAVTKRLAKIRKWLLKRLDEIPTRQISVSSLGFTLNQYEYQISVEELRRIIAELQRRFNTLPADEVVQAARAAYAEGTAQAAANLASITSGQVGVTTYMPDLARTFESRPWLRRVALIESRVFEEMRGFRGDAGRDLARVLSESVENGISPLDAADQIRERFGVQASRAERIARTEITGALRRARWDEDLQAEQDLGIKTRQMHLSALSPTTRVTHAQRHGKLYTQEQIREWYMVDGNAINCKCSQVAVLVDDDGNPLTPGVVE